jgi:multiple sugar transport system permease protein
LAIKKKRAQRIFWNVINLIIIAYFIGPILVLFVGSIQTEKSLFASARDLYPQEFTIINYRILAGYEKTHMEFPKAVRIFPRIFGNSFAIGTVVSFLNVLIGALAAYTISRLRYKWKTPFVSVSMASRMIPLIVLIIPLYIMISKFGLVNSLYGVIIVETVYMLPYAIIILVPFFAAIPLELEDAARCDGCTRATSFFKVVVPLSAPGMASCVVIIFMFSWHQLLIPLLLITSEKLQTVPLLLATLTSEYLIYYTTTFAICLVGTTPTILMVLLLRKFVERGLLGGALKG